VIEDCRALEDPSLYEPDPADAWKRLAACRSSRLRCGRAPRYSPCGGEKTARLRNLPRGWFLADEALFRTAESLPESPAALVRDPLVPGVDERGPRRGLLESCARVWAKRWTRARADLRPTPEQKALADRLAGVVDSHAARSHQPRNPGDAR